MANMLPPGLFDPTLPIADVKRLFSIYVEVIEIENHSYCNRTCWFCPNATVDRRSENVPMPPAVYEGILSDLGGVGYTQRVKWCGYHESLADDSIYDNLARARRALPRAFLEVYSNGDYINRQSIRRLEDTGIDRLYISFYPPDGKERDRATVEKSLAIFERRSGLRLVERRRFARAYGDTRLFAVEGTSLKVALAVKDFTLGDLTSRGGTIDITKRVATWSPYRRRATCIQPVRYLNINWNGKAMLCAETRSDVPAHHSSVIGDLTRPGYSIFHYYRDLAAARADLVSTAPKTGVCASCPVGAVGSLRWGRHPALSSALRSVPGLLPLFEAVQQRYLRRRANSL